MTIDPAQLLTGLQVAVFLAVLLFVLGIHQLRAGRRAQRETIKRRLRLLAAAESPPRHVSVLRRGRRERPPVGRPLGQALRGLEALLRQAGVGYSAPRVLRLMGLVSLAVFLGVASGMRVAMVPAPPLPVVLALAALAALAMGVAGPVLYLKRQGARRLTRFAAQLPEALELMVRSLRAGHPVNAAMAMVAREMPAPMGSEIGTVVDEMTYGLDLATALANLAGRVPVDDVRYVIVSINLQHETGGNLAEILSGLAGTMRARFRLAKKIGSLSAEARLSAKMLAAMPLIFGALVFTADPGFYLEVAGDPLFVPVLAGAAALEVLGILVMRRLVRPRV